MRAPLFVLATLSLSLAAGCHRHERGSLVSYTVTPDLVAHTASVTCSDSSTGTCHFVFDGDAQPTELSLKVGDVSIVRNVTASTLFCGEAHQAALAHCEKRELGAKKHTDKKQFSSDDAAN